MRAFDQMRLPDEPTVLAPDGSQVRVLLALEQGSMAHFHLPPGAVARAVRHQTVHELWYVLSGGGQLWRLQSGREDILALEPGLSLTIPLGTCFQFRASPECGLSVVAVTMPPWPGADEAVMVRGPWRATV